MDHYQRVGTFVVRIIGSIAILVGVIGVGYATAVKAGLVSQPASDGASMAVSVFWLACGLILQPLSERLGVGWAWPWVAPSTKPLQLAVGRGRSPAAERPNVSPTEVIHVDRIGRPAEASRTRHTNPGVAAALRAR